VRWIAHACAWSWPKLKLDFALDRIKKVIDDDDSVALDLTVRVKESRVKESESTKAKAKTE